MGLDLNDALVELTSAPAVLTLALKYKAYQLNEFDYRCRSVQFLNWSSDPPFFGC